MFGGGESLNKTKSVVKERTKITESKAFPSSLQNADYENIAKWSLPINSAMIDEISLFVDLIKFKMNIFITVMNVTFPKYIFKELCLMEKFINEGDWFIPSLQIKYILL